MASLLNSQKDTSASFLGKWEDIKDYTNVILTLSSPVDGSATIQWANTEGRALPTDNDIIASEKFTYLGKSDTSIAVTKQFDHRARWFRVTYDHVPNSEASFNDMSFNMQTLYKKAPTELKIVDDSSNIVSVNAGDNGQNSLYTMLTDGSGVPLRTTNDSHTTGEALYTHLTDSSGLSLDTTDTDRPESLFVALRDASNIGFSSTGADVSHNALYVRPGDVSGNAQASTFKVSDAYTDGVALYAALADNCGHQIDTTNKRPGGATNNANALYVHLADHQGNSINRANPLPVVNTQETVGALAFDVSYGVEQALICPVPDMSSTDIRSINLYNIFVYNDSPVTVWMKIYDVCYEDLSNNGLLRSFPTLETSLTVSLNALSGNNGTPKYNITVPSGRARDLVLPGGATFNNGVFFRATTQYKNSSVQGPGPNTVFLNGSYTKE